jgi:hypothetical protein
MAERDDEAIAKQEADETVESISNLDDIGDTMFVAVTFFLAALATWTPFALRRLGQMQRARYVVIALVVCCAVAIGGCVFFLAISLAPRAFYGPDVGGQFLDDAWLLWRNDDPGAIKKFKQRRDAVNSESDLREGYEWWLKRYDSDVDISSKESFEFSRLLNYKLVARTKAHYTAYGVAFFRIATLLFVVLVAVTLLVPFVA